MLAKLPKGCTLTVCTCTLYDNFKDVNAPILGSRFRGGAGTLLVKPGSETGTLVTKPFSICPTPGTSLSNLFMPPVFHLHSDYKLDPKVTMEDVQGPDTLHDIKATVVCDSMLSLDNYWILVP
ncbi:hypothetical protein RSOL_190280 [Rhizoctonia solani AG-3 Rhs1AP]|uniref:Uncharacterized protein n=1 Tax=Rhizoctonia solani AG-3 Rhs1AP TaxID=1086054 RepID=X8J605_9AGAM|nr:hypothetical protein RSOL_190280 [Rhizoctonia solani AG-3 Rhs1AP]